MNRYNITNAVLLFFVLVIVKSFSIDEPLKKILSKIEEDGHSMWENDTLLQEELFQCVDYDLRHRQFIKYCLMIAAAVINTKNCPKQSTQPLECILSTYYIGKRYNVTLVA